MHEIPPLAQISQSHAWAINCPGRIVGEYVGTDQQVHGYVYEGGALVDADVGEVVREINDRGQIATGRLVGTEVHTVVLTPVATASRCLRISSGVDRSSAPAGSGNGYTITVTNPNTVDVSVDSISATLPEGFTYTSGSTTGAVTADPLVADRSLTFSGPVSAPASGETSIHFNVTTSSVPGDYTIDAGATASGYRILSARRAARVTVTSTNDPSPPPYTISYYIEPANGELDAAYRDRLFEEGRRVGQAVVSGALPPRITVILNFGGQHRQANAQGNPVWGTKLIIPRLNHPFVTMGAIRGATKVYARGFYRGTEGYAAAFLELVLGTNNKLEVSAEAGRVWADEGADRINEFLEQNPKQGPQQQPLFPFIQQARVHGGSDIEAAYGDPDQTSAWAAAMSANGEGYWVYFGNCEGCPEGAAATTFSASTPTGAGPLGSPAWTVDDVYFVSWGVGHVRIQPQIYALDGVDAAKWESMAEHALEVIEVSGGRPMKFRGTLTTHFACAPEPEGQGRCTSEEIEDTNNTPEQGWLQLWRVLNRTSEVLGRDAPDLSQGLRYSTERRMHLTGLRD